MQYYTRNGDDGYTSLLGKSRFPKHDPIFEAIGNIDELNSAMGVALYYIHDDLVRREVKAIQNDLFVIGTILASFKDKKIKKKKLNDGVVDRLEKAIDEMEERTPKLTNFVIPGGCEGSVHLHVARAIARRAERSIFSASNKHKIKMEVSSYIARLSSYLFVAAIYLNYVSQVKETHPIH